MAADITLQQMFRTPTIIGLVSRVRSPLSLFQRFYNLTPGSPAVIRASGRELGWDLFDFTRSIAKGRAPMTGPATVSRKAVGHVSAVAYRSHEKLPIPLEEVARIRPLGGQIGRVDARGQAYVARQVAFMTQRFQNAREFMISRMFRGGFGLSLVGEEYIPVELGAGDFDVDFQLPAANLTDCQLGSGAAILAGDWQNASADIIGQLLELEKAYERVTGRSPRHFWINGTEFGNMLGNTALQSVGGSAFRVWDSLNRRELEGSNNPGSLPDTGYDVVFRAMPNYIFHVYNGVLLSDTTGNEVAYTSAISTSSTSLLIPDNKMIITPEPSTEWLGIAEGSEVIQERLNSAPREVFGFNAWATPAIDPPVIEMKMLDNFLPALFIPRAICYGTISA